MCLKNLCRLCGLKEDMLKDLKDENNKSVLNIVRDFIQIEVTDSDDLPTKICLNCEHTIVSFQLFVLECYRVQDILRKNDLRSSESNGIIIEISEANENNLESSGGSDVKLENINVDYAVSDIKTEVKDEFSAEDIVIAIGNQDLSGFDDSVCNEYLSDGDCEEDDVAIATLKKLKKEVFTVASEVNTNKLDELYMIPTEKLKLTDFFKFTCHVCGESSNTLKELTTHCLLAHKKNPYVTCICGQVIKSKNLIHNHYKWHQRESKKFLKECNESEIRNETRRKYLKNLSDYVKFTCQTCLKEFSSWYKLKSHCESAHKLKTVVRCKCGAILKSKSMLYKHTQDHNNPSAICCDKCPRVLKTEAALAKHKLRHIPKSERRFTCGTCNKIFHTKDCLKSHQKSHIPIEERKIYHCDVCNLKFTTRSSATSHKRVVHEKIKSYVCDLCGYACGTNGELRQHRAIHSDDKPHTCNKCSKSFKTYSNLKTHMDTHEDTSYECYVCSRVLNSRRTLRKHLLVHEDKARHVCSYCNKAFKRRQTLKVHMYTHTGDKPLSCKWCEEKFSYASTLRSHRLRCHPDKTAPAQQPVASHDPHAPRDPHDPHDPRDPHHSLDPYALSQVHAAVRAAVHQDYIKEDLAAKNEVEYAINKSQ